MCFHLTNRKRKSKNANAKDRKIELTLFEPLSLSLSLPFQLQTVHERTGIHRDVLNSNCEHLLIRWFFSAFTIFAYHGLAHASKNMPPFDIIESNQTFLFIYIAFFVNPLFQLNFIFVFAIESQYRLAQCIFLLFIRLSNYKLRFTRFVRFVCLFLSFFCFSSNAFQTIDRKV